MTVNFTRNREVSVAYETAGPLEGEPLLFIAGIESQLLHWPPEFVDALVAQGFRLARLDNRDVGLSAHLSAVKPPSIGSVLLRPRLAPYRLDDMADDTLAVADALGWNSALVVGFSMAGTIAQTLAIRH